MPDEELTLILKLRDEARRGSRAGAPRSSPPGPLLAR